MAQFVVLVVAENQREHVKDEQGSKKFILLKSNFILLKSNFILLKST
jgi:hypothetical protein